MTVKVIRIIQYEGTEEAVRAAIQRSLPLGIKEVVDYTITVAEHLNELPQLVQMDNAQVSAVLSSVGPVEWDPPQATLGPFTEAVIEEKAQLIYRNWFHKEGWVPWVTNGNSHMQTEARAQARKMLKL